MKILVVNFGSSSLKISCFHESEENPFWRAHLEWKDKNEFFLGKIFNHLNEIHAFESRDKPLNILVEELLKSNGDLKDIQMIGHRVVHGGMDLIHPTRIDQNVKLKIFELSRFAPLHNPLNLEGIEMMEKLFPNILQIAVFDTAFHHTIKPYISTYPIPYELKKKGYIRYGFHGISHEYCMNQALNMVSNQYQDPKIICCHLGNGASIAAIHKGKSIDTTMGFTPMEGLMMGTRSGSIDPGIMIDLLKNQEMDPKKLDWMLNQESGLKGITNEFSDMRDIEREMKSGNQMAKLAFDMYIHSLNGYIGKMAASLQGVDILIYTAGIGENSKIVREASLKKLKFLDLTLDDARNQIEQGDRIISPKNSLKSVLVIETKEDLSIKNKCLSRYL